MVSLIVKCQDRDDDGFTLIELMVVVLIIAIRLAIAIPTFLGARNGANARAAQSNLRNALTAEDTNWTNNQTFASSLTSLESALQWDSAPATTGNNVYAVTGDSGAAVVIEAQGKDNNCYYILQSRDSANSFTGYQESTGTCGTPSVPTTISTVTVTQGPASAHATTFSPTAWYSTF